MKNVYFKRKGKLTREKLNGFSSQVAKDISVTGLPLLRQTLKADRKSPVLVVVK